MPKARTYSLIFQAQSLKSSAIDGVPVDVSGASRGILPDAYIFIAFLRIGTLEKPEFTGHNIY